MIDIKTSLLKDFYKIKDISKIDDNKMSANILLNVNHKIFEGHFPGHPVTPGVCMMQIIKEMTEKFINKPLQLKTAENVKFVTIINPEINPEIKVDFNIEEKNIGEISVKSTTFFEDTAALKFSGIYNVL